MRSTDSRGRQGVLPFAAPDPVPRPRDARRAPDPADQPVVVRLGDELARARSWPAGTEVVVVPIRRPERGDVLVVDERGRRRAGIFDRRFGRPVVCNDHGVAWIGPGSVVVGVVTQVGPPLDGMPSAALRPGRGERRD